MTLRVIATGLFVGLLLLCVGLFLTPMIGATQEQAQNHYRVNQGDTVTVDDELELNVTQADVQNGTVTAQFRDLRDYSTNTTAKLNQSESGSVSLSSSTLTTTNVGTDGDSIIVRVTYPPTFGMGDAATAFFENLGLILAMTGFAIVIMTMWMGVRQA